MKFTFFAVLLLIFLPACSGGGGGSNETQEIDEVQNININDNCSQLIDGPPRGLSCLHCTQSQAREQVDEIIQVMLDSCLRNLSTAYLVDGTFEPNQQLLREHIDALTSGGRKLFLIYYFGNGPAQRRSDITDIRGFGSTIGPPEFRVWIQTDEGLRQEFVDLVQDFLPVIEYAVARGASVNVVPMLEDNLTDPPFVSFADLTRGAIPSNLPVTIGRSFCAPNCYPLNERGVPAGIVPELHTDELPIDISNGFVSNDGFDYESPATGPNPRATTSLDALREIRDEAEALGNIFILWSAIRQGLPPGIADIKFPIPSLRDYPTPTKAEKRELIEFLQENL